MSKEAVNSSLKSYQVVRVKGDCCPQFLSILYVPVLMQQQLLVAMLWSSICTEWDKI